MAGTFFCGFVVAACALAGCAGIGLALEPSVAVGLRSFGDSNYPPGARFVVVPGKKGVAADAPEFGAYAACVARALGEKGFREAGDGAAPDFEVRLNYGVSKPETIMDGTSTVTWTRDQPNYNHQTAYTRFVALTAYDTKTHRRVWRTELESIGPSDALREVFPVLVAAGIPYFGHHCATEIRRSLAIHSPAVEQLQGPEAPLPGSKAGAFP